jgi:hypothetical protein
MAFDQTVIADVAVFDHLGDLGISWRSAAPAGTTFQVYLDRALSWAGVARRAIVPMPDVGREVRVDVGAVGEGEGGTDFSASLPAAPGGGRTVRLDWRGGTYEDLGDDIAGFHVYMSAVAGAAVNYGVPVATVAAYPGGEILDGFGLGEFGEGGFGRSNSNYTWTSDPLSGGLWRFNVKPFDLAGNEGPATVDVTATIAAPPGPPAPDANGIRLRYTYDPVSHTVTLLWSPPA